MIWRDIARLLHGAIITTDDNGEVIIRCTADQAENPFVRQWAEEERVPLVPHRRST